MLFICWKNVEGKIGVHTFAFSEVFLKACGLLKHSILEDEGAVLPSCLFKMTPLILEKNQKHLTTFSSNQSPG